MLRFTISCVLASIIALSLGSEVHAASLSLSPAASKVSVGNIVSLKVFVSTQGKSINNTESEIQFPSDLLEVLSISKNASIFSLWVEDPKFSNSTGKITLNGGIPNPGYIGERGEVISVTFKAKKSGTASVFFSDSAVRQNDGLGTDILTNKQGSVITIESAAKLEVPAVNTSSNNVPAKPVIISSTHPQQDMWYKSNSGSFRWVVSDDVVSVQSLLGKNPDSIPTVTYDSSVTQRTVNNISDGIFYFHLRYVNKVGPGPTAHYKVQIDTAPPEKFSVMVREDKGQQFVKLNATDALSGIDSYSLQVDNSLTTRVKKDALINEEYSLPTLTEGEHDLLVVAYDKAGNYTESRAHFSSPKITAPILKLSSEKITKDESIKVTGTTNYPKSSVVVFTRLDNQEIKEYKTTTADDGSFTITTENFKVAGSVKVWAQTIFTQSLKSPLSSESLLTVQDTDLVKNVRTVTYSLTMSIVILLLLIILLSIAYIGWFRLFGLKAQIKTELHTTSKAVHESLQFFKEELNRQLLVLERLKEDRELNDKEKEIFKNLQANIESIDSFIEKKLTTLE